MHYKRRSKLGKVWTNEILLYQFLNKYLIKAEYYQVNKLYYL